MNETINTPQKVIDKVFEEEKFFDLVIMQPEESQSISEIKQQASSIKFWKDIYSEINNFPKHTYEIVKFDELEFNFMNYQERIFKNNSRWFMRLLSFMPFLNIFQKLDIYFTLCF